MVGLVGLWLPKGPTILVAVPKGSMIALLVIMWVLTCTLHFEEVAEQTDPRSNSHEML